MRESSVYLTLRRAAEALGVHEQTLRSWERRGLIRMVRLPGSRYRRVPVEEVERLKREMSAAPGVSAARPAPSTRHADVTEAPLELVEAGHAEPSDLEGAGKGKHTLDAQVLSIHEPLTVYDARPGEIAATQDPEILDPNDRPIAVLVGREEYQAFQAWRRSQSWKEAQLAHLQAGRAAFQRLLPQLLKTHPGQFVAIHDGRVIDTDAAEGELAWRVISSGLKPVYIGEVRSEPRIYSVPSLEVIPHAPL